MSLSPRDIARKEFARVLRGYDPAEVRTYLEQLSDEVYDLQRQLTRLTELKPAKDQVTESAPPAAHESLDSLREEIEGERSRILHDAQIEAAELKQDALRDLSRIKEDIRNLKTQHEAYVKRVRLLLKSQVELLEILETETPETADAEIESATR